MDESSESQHAFVAFIAARACRADGRSQADLDRRKRYRLALVISLIVHGMLYFGIRHWSLLHRDVTADSTVIHLRLIDGPSVEPPREIVRASSPAQPAVAAHEKKSAVVPTPLSVRQSGTLFAEPINPVDVSNAVPAKVESIDSVSAIFDQRGRVILPAAVTDDPAVFGSRKHAPFTPNPMAHQSPLPYKATPFDRYWKPDGETLLGEWVRKASKEASYDTKYGTRVTCKAFLFLMACGWGPTPRVSIEELKAMRADPPAPRNSADDPWIPPIP